MESPLAKGDQIFHGGDQCEKKNMSFHSHSRSEFHFELSTISHFQIKPIVYLSVPVGVSMVFHGGIFFFQ